LRSREGRLKNERGNGRFDRDSRGSRNDFDDHPRKRRNIEEEVHLPKLSSAIVASKISSSRSDKDADKVNDSTNDTEIKQRNKKMFGVILGTLQQFKKEQTAGQKRKDMEDMVAAKEREEKDAFVENQKKQLTEQKAKEKNSLEEIRRKQEEKQMELLNETWESHKRLLSNYKKTKATPSIYWRERQESEQKEKVGISQDEKGEKGEKVIENSGDKVKNEPAQSASHTATESHTNDSEKEKQEEDEDKHHHQDLELP